LSNKPKSKTINAHPAAEKNNSVNAVSVRLQKLLSAHGVASRREAERMITDGRVRVNGAAATLGQSANVAYDVVTVDDVPLTDKDEHVYVMLNKPRGYVTTVRDEKGRKTVMGLVADVGVRIYPIGRLDINSEGLLLFTNDGSFANAVMHPSNEIHKTYEVDVSGDAYSAINLLRQPIEIDGHVVRALSVKPVKLKADGGIIRITIAEGRNRQVRKMCNACDVSVNRLKRISIGRLILGNLKAGSWRHLSSDEVRLLSVPSECHQDGTP